MSRLLKSEIPYPADGDTSQLFDAFAECPWAIWLDSGTEQTVSGRYDIMVAEPVQTIVTRNGITTITATDGDQRHYSDDPFELLREQLGHAVAVDMDGLPFAGGAVGFFSYDLARMFERLPEQASDDLAMPEMAVGVYEWAVVCDRQESRAWLVSNRYDDESSPSWQRLINLVSSSDKGECGKALHAVGPVTTNLTQRDYEAAFQRIQHYLREGDCYQVNFAQRFCVEVNGCVWEGYQRLRQRSAGPFSAYVNTPYGQILCTSPERFLRLEQGRVETRPIKGTRPRAIEPEQDRQLQEELRNSEKDRAENLMIVDLLRNDLGKSCRMGSVRVPELFALESFATVHHLVSTIICELEEGEDALSLLRACFPGGSITGAPKIRAMEIIDELEPHRRGVYCGSIGYIGFDGKMDSNIVIRTAIHKNGRLYYSAGGGIVRDSLCESEYQETFDKAAAFLGCFSTQRK